MKLTSIHKTAYDPFIISHREWAMPDRIDYQFISRLEGGRRQSAYVPAGAVSQSGVTVATGFDLGQRSESDLVRLGLSSRLIKQLKPYLGVQGQAAERLLKQKPLRLSPTDAQAIDRAVYQHELATLRKNYNRCIQNKSAKKFLALPKEAQTVLFSVAHQYGTNLNIRTPRFWRKACAQDWSKVIKELKHFGDNYPTRRSKEANLIKKMMQHNP